MTLNDIWQKYLDAKAEEDKALEEYRYVDDLTLLLESENCRGRKMAFLEIYNQLTTEEKEKHLHTLNDKQLQTLNAEYEKICQKYIDLFCKKQNLKFKCWIVNRVGDIACFGDCYFNFQDIMTDLITHAPKNAIFKWRDNQRDYATWLSNRKKKN